MYSLDFCLCLQIRGEESQNQESVNVQQCKRVTFDVCLYFIYMKLIHRVRLQIGSNWSGEGGNRIMYLLGNDRDGCNLLADDCASDCETLKKNCFVFLFFGWTCKCSSIRVCKAYEAVCVCVWVMLHMLFTFHQSSLLGPELWKWSLLISLISDQFGPDQSPFFLLGVRRSDFKGSTQVWIFTISTGQGRVLNVDVPWTFILSGSCFSTVFSSLKRRKKGKGSRDFRCSKSTFLFSCGWHFDCKYLLLVILLRWIYVQWVG